MSRRMFGLVGCGKAKQDEPAPAWELYTSTYFKQKANWVDANCDDGAVLSAEHGLLDPDETVAPYDTTASDSDFDADAWRDMVADQLAEIDWSDYDRLVVFAGQDYINPLRDVFAELPVDAVYPFANTDGLFEQQKWLTATMECGIA